MPKKARTIIAPLVTNDLTETNDKLVFWKQILPEDEIQYRHGGKTRRINFDSSYHHDLIEDFKAKRAIDQVHFQLAGSDNSHGRDWDPEKQRALVTEMATYDDLPDDVKAKVTNRGLYAKMKFFSKKDAKAVRRNPDLGVSARVRENFPRSDGTIVKRGIIHVLGTIDPRVPGMSGWQGADLSYDSEDGYVLDLSNESYEGDAEMAKNRKKKTAESTEVHIPTLEEIDAMSEDELDAFLADDVAELDEEEDDDDLEDDVEDDEDDEDEPVESKRTKETVSLSNTTKRRRRVSEIDLANARADAAESKADRALRRQAERDYLDFSNAEIALGVPPEVFDEDVEEILTRPDGMVVDLSNEGGSEVDVTEVVKNLLQRLRGTIDMSQESGHGGQFDASNGGVDPDKEILDALAAGR